MSNDRYRNSVRPGAVDALASLDPLFLSVAQKAQQMAFAQGTVQNPNPLLDRAGRPVPLAPGASTDAGARTYVDAPTESGLVRSIMGSVVPGSPQKITIPDRCRTIMVYALPIVDGVNPVCYLARQAVPGNLRSLEAADSPVIVAGVGREPVYVSLDQSFGDRFLYAVADEAMVVSISFYTGNTTPWR